MSIEGPLEWLSGRTWRSTRLFEAHDIQVHPSEVLNIVFAISLSGTIGHVSGLQTTNAGARGIHFKTTRNAQNGGKGSSENKEGDDNETIIWVKERKGVKKYG